jgi:type IV pilus assembly protein PilO
MATQIALPRVDVGSFADQFKNLDPKQPGQWGIGPKMLAWLATTAAVLGIGYVVLLSGAHTDLDNERGREPTLKTDYRSKLAQAVNLAELQKQKLQVEEYVTQLEKQLPGKAEMDALLSDINQAGLGRGLQFELFRPGSVSVKEYYAELPISIKVTGKYHDMGSFAADVANLSRIVTLHDINITHMTAQAAAQGRGATAAPESTGLLTMDATARTYRYLDQNEIKANAEAAAKAKAASKPAAAAPAATGGKK